ncbi:immunity 53 family protein [Streptomyces sp. NPDC048718]|uniref:immunity 53 family protein n=1 Tax=Streptomyces sp. NPDC048718 TaxID=3365587 RepID=UPI00371578BF
MIESLNELEWLQSWYTAQCDGDWEHEWGVRIATLDNPGWTVSIDLDETDVADREMPRREIRRGERDWIIAWTADGRFKVSCGPGNLIESLGLFRAWVAGSPE